MKANSGIVNIALIALGAVMLTSAPSVAGTPSSPAEKAATAKLNSDIANENAVADDHYAALQKEYLQEKKKNDQLHQEYQAKLKDNALQQAQYQEQKKQNDLLQQQYQDRLNHHE